MSSLADCIKIHKPSKWEAKRLNDLYRQYIKDGYTGDKASAFAVEGLLIDAEKDHADIRKQIEPYAKKEAKPQAVAPAEVVAGSEEVQRSGAAGESGKIGPMPDLQALQSMVNEKKKELDQAERNLKKARSKDAKYLAGTKYQHAKKQYESWSESLKMAESEIQQKGGAEDAQKETQPNPRSGEVQPEREAEGETQGQEKEVASERPAQPSQEGPVETIKNMTMDKLHVVKQDGGFVARHADTQEDLFPGKTFKTAKEAREAWHRANKDSGAKYSMAGPKDEVENTQTLIDDLNNTSMFKGRASVDDSGKVSVTLGGKNFKIETVDEIPPDAEVVEKWYGAEGEGKVVAGALIGDTIYITKHGDIYDVVHEGVHISEALGLLSKGEIGILNQAARKEGISQGISKEEQRAKFIQRSLKDREAYRGTITGRILQKIGDFLDKIANLVHLTSRGILREFESGDIFNRSVIESEQNPDAKYYSMLDDADIDEQMSEHFGRSEKTTKEKISDVLKALWTKEGRQYYFDKIITAGLDKELPILRKLGDKPYMLFSNARGSQRVFFNFLINGKIRREGDGVIVDGREKGVIPFLKERLGKDAKKFLYWVAAKRAEVLEGQGRENWLDKTARDKIFSKTAPANDQRFEETYKDFSKFIKNILDFSVEQGLINQDQRDTWEQYYYVPFYRLFEDENTQQEFLTAPNWSKKYISAQIKRLTGGNSMLGDPLENYLKNWSHMIQMSMQNRAVDEAAKIAVERGYAEELTSAPQMNKSKNVITFRRNGTPVYLKINDPSLFAAMTMVNPKIMDNFIGKTLVKTKRLLTYGATFGAPFKIRNTIRDATQVAIIEKNFPRPDEIVKAFWKIMKNHEDWIAFDSSGFAFGTGYMEEGGVKEGTKHINRILKEDKNGVVPYVINTLKKAVDYWEFIGKASENATRLALYLKKKEAGLSHFEAGFEAKDILDFSKSGADKAVQTIIAVTPFLNARAQGIGAIGSRAFKNKKAFASVIGKGGIYTAASIALWAAFKDDERYKKKELWERQSNHIFWIGDKEFRIPMAFETGTIFSALPLAIMDILNGTEKGKYIVDALAYNAKNTLALDMPQLVKPLIEQWSNKSTFTGRPIVSDSLKNLPEGQQYDWGDSETLKAIGELFNISPKRANALVQGYASTIGTYMLTALDYMVTRPVSWAAGRDIPERPSSITPDDWMGGFVKRDQPAANTKYITRFYEFATEVEKEMNGIRALQKLGKSEEARNKFKENRDKLKYYTAVEKTKTDLANINRQIKFVANSKLVGDEKRNKMDKLLKIRDRLTEKISTRIGL